MSAPVVVQGTAVTAAPIPAQVYGDTAETGVTTPTPAKTGCNDPIFALLFYGNVAAQVVVALVYGRDAVVGGENYQNFVYAALVFSGCSFAASLVGLFMLIACPALMIKAGLIFTVVIMIAWTAYSFLYVGLIWGIFAAVFLMFTLCYVKLVWSRIPFAAINMKTGGTAIKANLGVTICAMFFTLLSVGWLVLWSISLSGIYEKTYFCDANGRCSPDYGVLFGMFLSLFFGQQVLQSCVHVTVAGTVGTWWVAPEESGCCSKAICNSFIRTITTSFGSICFGSLLVAIIQALRAIASTARNSDECQLVACIFECILSCLQSILEYFNKWAFIYVGVYGNTYIESGKAVMQLFANRGWEAIIADDLVGGAIGLLCVMIGLIIGGIAVGYAQFDPAFRAAAQNSNAAAFVIGLLAGLVICSILLGTVASAVNTVIVMFADAPQEFQTNYPELSAEMRAEWQKFYPGSIQ
mmetsp:Transcript_16490/g.41371  ORF Transcript_16490/g.41371 Transcript_16490/m.41371 type:complete len:467 (-) Transcript_16490:1309-2709(-)